MDTACDVASRTRRRRVYLSGAVLIAAGVAWWLLKPAPEVEVTRPELRGVVELVSASGRLRSVHRSEIGTEVPGVVEEVAVDVGDRVESGATLVRLRDADALQRLELARLAARTAQKDLDRISAGATPEEIERAEAVLAEARAGRERDELELERLRRLGEDASVARADLESAALKLDASRARERGAEQALKIVRRGPRAVDVELARSRLEEATQAVETAKIEAAKRTIVAPFDGVVIDEHVGAGQSVSPGVSLLTLAETDGIEVFVETDENNLGRLSVGQTATVIAPAYPDEPFPAKLSRIDPAIDVRRGVIGVRLIPDRLPESALLDMTVDVNIEVGRWENALTLPVSAVVRTSGATRVYVVEDGTVVSRDINVLGSGGGYHAITGLDGDGLYLLDAARAQPGSHVRVREVE